MPNTSALHKAKQAKKDEFYTQYPVIQAEIEAYLEYDPDTFRGKTVLLPCDDPEWSNFTRYFAENFSRLGLKKLISTSYAPDAKRNKYGILLALPRVPGLDYGGEQTVSRHREHEHDNNKRCVPSVSGECFVDG